MTTTKPGDRRSFSRIVVQRDARFINGSGEHEVLVEDLSLKGVLLRLDETIPIDQQARHTLRFDLDEETAIEMTLRLAHRNGDQAGFHCTSLDLDSAAHLRRVIEFNLGDPELLHRELGDLVGET